MKYASILASSAREDGLPKKKLNKYTYILQIGFFSYHKQIIIKTNKSRFILFERDWKEIGRKLLKLICKIKINLCLLIVLIKT